MFTAALLAGRFASAQTGHSPPVANDPLPDVLQWSAAAFTGAPPPVPGPRRVVELALRRQDFGQLGVNQSVIGTTPLKIGRRTFQHGLGTHANSEIAVSFPPGSVRSLKAFVGVDNNSDTRGEFGSVEFSVQVAGKSVFHSRTLRGGEEPLPVEVEVPEGIDQILLKVDMTPDGPAHDHADWASAQLLMRNGASLWLDELPLQQPGSIWPASRPPFSFVYDGQSSETFFASWKHESQNREFADHIEYRVQWDDPQTGLKATALVTAFKDFPAVEWFLRFENAGTKDTPILEKIQALDVTLDTSPAQKLVLDQINGDDASERSFVPVERALPPGQTVALAPVGGRPSNGTFPFFNLQQGSRGFFTAIGWTGEWAATASRNEAGATHLQAGMELTHLSLHPGESIRTPRILLLPWSGDRLEAHNQFRRLLLAHYLPKPGGQPVRFAFAAQTYNTWAGGARPIWATEAGQLAAAKINRELGCDTLWLDAGWFEGDFPNAVGNWFPKPKEFPNGLGPIGRACEDLGLRFLVWFEPERVGDNTQIAREHPGFVLPANKTADKGGLFNLGDPLARRWLTDLLVRLITDSHIHTYRNDFNMDPLPYWRQNDPPDRQGMTEIRYVEGLYALWDELRAKFPNMYLDDCASGGRRIDLEMVMRSVVQTRSDFIGLGHADCDQSQTYGLSLYLPVHATIGWEVGAYPCRSSAVSGFCAEWDILDEKFPIEQARRCISEMKENSKYWTGDYYPLTPWTTASDRWMAWQLHRADLDEGMILAFRHQQCPYSALQVNPRGLKSGQSYQVTFIDEDHHSVAKTMSERQLSALELSIPARHQSLLVRYAPAR
jgi:alpha-galactosidase